MRSMLRRTRLPARRPAWPAGCLVLFGAVFLSANILAQHDPGRNAVQLLAQGKIEAAIKLLGEAGPATSSPVGEADRYYVLTMAACQQGDLAAAVEHARRAVELGLPVERIQAGPRDVFAPLSAQPAFAAWLEPKQKELLHGPMLGSLTDSSGRVWVRTAREAEVRVEVRPVDAAGSAPAVATGTARTSRQSDYTATIAISGLQPDTRYAYAVRVNGRPAGPAAQFSTFPQRGAAARFRVGFGGGAGYTPQHERMWTTIANRGVAALLLLGDNVYIDAPGSPLVQRYCYYRRQSQPEWRRLVAATSVAAIYDDHDFGTNNCVPGPDIEHPRWKRKVWNVFRENWNNPAYGGGETQPGCWFDFQVGNVHFIMLDGRYYRDLNGGSMLGPVQKAWLLDTLRTSPGVFKVLAADVPWSPGVKPGSQDSWDGFAAEREEIFSHIERHRINGVILLAADRHRSDLRRIRRPRGYDLYEAMSSRLTNVQTNGLVKNAEGSEWLMGYNEKCSFGLLEFDTTAADPQVTCRIINIDNEEVGSRVLKLSELSCPAP